MLSATLYESDRIKPVEEISEPRATQLRILQELYPGKGREDLPMHYVSDDRNLRTVKPIICPPDHSLDRTVLQPLLDALEKGDIELACALAPEGKRLCGYRAITESFDYQGWGAYAEDIWSVRIAAGIYPIFIQEFQFNEVENTFTSQVKDYPGILDWYDGTIIIDNLSPASVGKYTPVFSHGYCHQFAKAMLEQGGFCITDSTGSHTHLIHPFRAQEIPFLYDGKPGKTYGIFDTTLPELLPQGINPIHLRNGGKDLQTMCTNFTAVLSDAKARASAQNKAHMGVQSHIPNR